MTKSKTRSPFEIYGESIAAGERKGFDLPVPDLYVHTQLSLPVHVIHGKSDGPVMFVSGAVHGDEILGVEIIRRVLASKRLSRLRGTLIAIPVVNIFGFLNQSRYLPDRRDLNRSFPGSQKGSIAGRLANVFISEIVQLCDYGVDLHTAAVNRENLPQVRGDTSDEVVAAMALAFGLPVVIDSKIIDGSLRGAASTLGTKVLVYEAGEALRFNETAIRAGVNGVLKVMEHLGMLRQRVRKDQPRRGLKEPTISTSSSWLRAPQSGIHRAIAPLGAQVKVGDCLGFIADTIGHNEEPVTSKLDGVIIGRSTIPLVTEGEALFNIATFTEEDKLVAAQIDRVEGALDIAPDLTDLDEPPIV